MLVIHCGASTPENAPACGVYPQAGANLSEFATDYWLTCIEI